MRGRLFYRLHARQQMAERNVTPADVVTVVSSGDLIEDTHHAGRPFPTQLWLGWIDQRPLHVVLAVDPSGDKYVITVYEPDAIRWDETRPRRREQS